MAKTQVFIGVCSLAIIGMFITSIFLVISVHPPRPKELTPEMSANTTSAADKGQEKTTEKLKEETPEIEEKEEKDNKDKDKPDEDPPEENDGSQNQKTPRRRMKFMPPEKSNKRSNVIVRIVDKDNNVIKASHHSTKWEKVNSSKVN